MFDFLLDIAEQTAAGIRTDPVAIFKQTGCRAQNGRKGSAEVMGNRGEHGIAHALRLHGGLNGKHVFRQHSPFQCRGGLLCEGFEQRLRFGIHRVGAVQRNPDHADNAIRRTEREKKPGHEGQGGCAMPCGFSSLEGPPGG